MPQPTGRVFVSQLGGVSGALIVRQLHEAGVNQAGEQYDMIKMFAFAMLHGGNTGEGIRNQLAVLKGVPSLFGGQIVMDPDHYSIRSGDTLWKVDHGKLVRAI